MCFYFGIIAITVNQTPNYIVTSYQTIMPEVVIGYLELNLILVDVQLHYA